MSDPREPQSEYDLVIVGSGIAGLSFALKVAEAGYRVAIFTKKDKAESNTNYAQGGIAAVTSSGDDLDKHVHGYFGGRRWIMRCQGGA